MTFWNRLSTASALLLPPLRLLLLLIIILPALLTQMVWRQRVTPFLTLFLPKEIPSLSVFLLVRARRDLWSISRLFGMSIAWWGLACNTNWLIDWLIEIASIFFIFFPSFWLILKRKGDLKKRSGEFWWGERGVGEGEGKTREIGHELIKHFFRKSNE